MNRDLFYREIEDLKRNWDIKLHIRSSMKETCIEVRRNGSLIARVTGETEEEACGKAMMDIELWKEAMEKERQQIEGMLRKVV